MPEDAARRNLPGSNPKAKPKMPLPSFRRGLCSCFGNHEPPEITYCMVGQDGTLNLQSVPPSQPIPDEEELNAKFIEFLDELDLAAPNRQAMLSLPPEKKWQIYCSRKKKTENSANGFLIPEEYVKKLQELLKIPQGEECITSNILFFDGLKTALRTEPNSFVLRFIESEGLSVLLKFLSCMEHVIRESGVHTSVIGCFKALMNNSSGRAHVLVHPSSINIIAQSLATENIRTKVAVLEILGAVCLVPDGHKKVLEAMLHYQQYASERTRFQSIVNDLDRDIGAYRGEVGLKTAIMSFINAVLSYGPGEDNLEFRLHLRYEFLMLGIQPVIDKLRSYENATLDRHLDFFEMVRNEDEKELARRYEEVHIDAKSASSLFEVLRRKLSHTVAYPHMLSLLYHCLLLPLEYSSCAQHWLLLDRVTQQIILQFENGDDPDVSPLKINVKDIIHLLASEQELILSKNRAEALEHDNIDLATQLVKKEQECESLTHERDDLQSSLDRLKEKLEKESVLHLEAKQRLLELEQQSGYQESALKFRVDSLIPSSNAVAKSNIPAPPAPPPLPLLMPASPAADSNVVVKDIPPSSNPLKSFNWSKLPDSRVSGTLWAEMDETPLLRGPLDLKEVDQLFSAYQRHGSIADGSVEDVRQGNRSRMRVLSVIDSRRAQNCTILLSRLRMSNDEILSALLSMDQQDKLPPDMVEQLLKFTPSAEECALLDEHRGAIELMARADRFLYDISRFPHYEGRLRTLLLRKKFPERVCEISARAKAVLEASREIIRSRKLRKLLEVVLAFGNYMNRGPRGNARGFRLVSLNRIADTKSSYSKCVTLLHYLSDTLERKFRDVLRVKDDIPHVHSAAKVSLTELEQDVNQLKAGLDEVSREIEWHRQQKQPVPGDRYLLVMREFFTSSTVRFRELEDLVHESREKYDQCVRYFGEEDTFSGRPDEFFGVFEGFFTSFCEAHQDNQNSKRKKEEEAKRAQQEEELKRRTLDRKQRREGSRGQSNGLLRSNNSGEFDDLIAALRTGDVFGEDIAKLKRNRKRIGGGSTEDNSQLGRERIINVNA